MTALIKTLIAGISVLLFTSCNFSQNIHWDMNGIEGNGRVVSREIPLTDTFNSIDASDGWEIILRKGNQDGIKAELDENLYDYLDIHVSGNTLKIKSNHKDNIGDATSKVIYVTYSGDLNSVAAHSAASIKSENELEGESISFAASSAGTVNADVRVRNVNADASSAGTITLQGLAESLKAEASSAGTVNAKSLKTEITDARASSAGNIKVSASRQLSSNASSAGTISYWGEPKKVRTIKSVGGSVHKR